LRGQGGTGDGPKPEARRHPNFKNLERNAPVRGRDLMRLVMVVVLMRVGVTMTMTVIMMLATAQEPCACDIYRQTKAGDRDRFGKMNRNRIENTTDGFIADQKRNHGQDDSAGEACEIAEFAGPEREGRIVGVFAGVSIGERRQQQRPGVRAHVHSIGHQRDRAEQQAADDFRDHHDSAEPDHRPGLALARLVPFREKEVAMKSRRCAAAIVGHGVAHFK
jgi:hypothetical protein